MPEDSKKSMMRSGGKLRHAGRTNCAPQRMWAEKAPQSLTLVKLQRPLPVIMTLRAGRGIFSKTHTLRALPSAAAWRAALQAAMSPEAPPPMTMTSYFILVDNVFTNINKVFVFVGGND
jgi:hypothetical protein